MNFYKNNSQVRSINFFKLITKIKNKDKRNLIRGCSNQKKITTSQADNIRQGSNLDDCMLIGALLKGEEGLLNKQSNVKKHTCKDLFVITPYIPLGWKNEVCYTIGYLNSIRKDVLAAIQAMELIIKLDNSDGEKVFDQLLIFAEQYGASNFLSYKLAYFRNSLKLSAHSSSIISKIENEMQHRECAGFHVSALENISANASLFLAAQRKVNSLSNKFDGNFRTAISLSNFVPTPLNLEDISYFLIRATSSTLIDTIYSVLILFNLRIQFDEVYKEIASRLDSKLFERIQGMIKFSSTLSNDTLITDHYIANDASEDKSFIIYRISAAFLERPQNAIYRNKIDRVISVRLLTDIYNKYAQEPTVNIVNKELLLNNNNNIVDSTLDIPLDSFYRTYLFLLYIGNYKNIVFLTNEDVKFIFENTIYLDILLTEKEIQILSASASPNSITKNLLSVLALALYKRKSIDQDADYEFRNSLMMYVKQDYQESIPDFVDSLLEKSPAIAQYIVESLDTVTLEKMYLLVKSSSDAAKIRTKILRAVGQKSQNIDYIIEADRIETRTKLLSLQQYFDSSRIYVDSVAMKHWLDSNPTVAAEEYRDIYSLVEELPDEDDSSDVLLETLLAQIAKEAFEQFCLNAEFGIQSYLSRRIRHNTLDGITKETVDAVLRKSDYAEVMNSEMKRNVKNWLSSYQNIVNELRCKYLQFESNTVGGALFNANLDLSDQITQDNIHRLSNNLANLGEKFLHELLITFCWVQITPQLDNAARFIRTTILQEANASIDKYFSNTHNPIHVEAQLKTELHEAVNSVFKKVADWFQVPQTGFISASVIDLCQIISDDLGEKKTINFDDIYHEKYSGMGVHRLYDCIAVLLQNAYKHGKCSEQPIKVAVDRLESHAGLDKLRISVTSEVEEEKYESAKKRVLEAIHSQVESSTDMITEGYTGLSKIKFITKSHEGGHTVGCRCLDEQRSLVIHFTLNVEKESQITSLEVQ